MPETQEEQTMENQKNQDPQEDIQLTEDELEMLVGGLMEPCSLTDLYIDGHDHESVSEP